jgi:predicted aspartyl protease
MTGSVDTYGRALLPVEVAVDELTAAEVLDVWVDTGFTGDLVIPQTEIDRMGLQECGTIEGVLADGTTGRFRKYACWIE